MGWAHHSSCSECTTVDCMLTVLCSAVNQNEEREKRELGKVVPVLYNLIKWKCPHEI